MKKLTLATLVLLVMTGCKQVSEEQPDFTTVFEQSQGTETPPYPEVIDFYERLAKQYATVQLFEMGPTDSGYPLHLVVFDTDGQPLDDFSNPNDKAVLLINNGIHPGESDGIDASMMLFRDLAQGVIAAPQNTLIAAIPVYNIGGALQRNDGTRTNQNGPKEYGFRGNARNFDLNRDFIKADTRNAQSFQKIFQLLDPDAFIDNHVSNGADYQYTLTHLFTQHNKLGGQMGRYLFEEFQPSLEDSLAKKQWDITPYVNVFNRTPDQGFSQFMDYPRYSSGYTTLFNSLGMMVETHMLKPYKPRVEGTYELMKSFIGILDAQANKLQSLRSQMQSNYAVGTRYPLQWAIDSSQTSTLEFKGFEGRMVPSEITGQSRLMYDRDAPFTKPVTYYDRFKPTTEVVIPSYYVIPKGYWNILEQLKNNGITYKKLKADTSFQGEVYHIKDYKTYTNAYEGHYPHYQTEVTVSDELISAKKGDVLVPTQQAGVRYLLETLEPMATDSFFNWNYFDAILQQKEGFSPYVWEDKALDFLDEHPEIKSAFEAKKDSDPAFAANWYAQLDWIHKQSGHYEKSHLRYPIVRVR